VGFIERGALHGGDILEERSREFKRAGQESPAAESSSFVVRAERVVREKAFQRSRRQAIQAARSALLSGKNLTQRSNEQSVTPKGYGNIRRAY
jgi:hypothetical protein